MRLLSHFFRTLRRILAVRLCHEPVERIRLFKNRKRYALTNDTRFALPWKELERNGCVIAFVIRRPTWLSQAPHCKQLGGEGSRTLCLHLPKLLMKCKCLGEFDIIGPQKLARVLRKRHAMAHTRHTPTAFQSHERRRCQNPLGDSNGDEPRLPCAPERLADLKF